MIFNITYAKKHFVCFVLKSIIGYNIFLIAMDDWWFVIVCCLIEDHPKKDCRAKVAVPNISNIAKFITDLWIFFIDHCGRGGFLGVSFRNSLKVLGVAYRSQGMIRG
jgi:hypothetical protein